jgi:hypothetical protein
MKTAWVSLLVAVFSVLASSCGGGGGGADASALRGQFIDSPVAGLTYTTASQKGVTSADGSFDYAKGEQVTFSLGEIVFPKVKASLIVTPLSMAPGNNIDADEAQNIAYLLQALDDDGIPSNGINIPASIAPLAKLAVDFSIDPSLFVALPQVVSLAAEVAKLRTPGMAPTTLDSASAHLSSSLSGMLDNRMITLGTQGCTKPRATDQYRQLSTALWASIYAEPSNNWFYAGSFASRVTNPMGALLRYTPKPGSLEMRAARVSGEWDEAYSATQDHWYRHQESEDVVIRIAAKKGAQETANYPAYMGAAIYLHYIAKDESLLEVELDAGYTPAAYFSFVGPNAATLFKANAEGAPIAKMHWGGTTPEGRQLGAYNCLLSPGSSVLLWRRPTGRTDLFFSPDSKSNLQGDQIPVYESGKGYAGSVGLRAGVKTLNIVR